MDGRGVGAGAYGRSAGAGDLGAAEKRRRLGAEADGYADQRLSLHPSLHPQVAVADGQPGLLRSMAWAGAPLQSLGLGAAGPPQYRAEFVLGKGSFGVVYKATVVGTGQAVAIKSVKMKDSSREVSALLRLRGGAYVSQLLGTFPGYADAAPEDRILNLVLEFVPDTLNRIIKHHRTMGAFMDMHFVRLYGYQLLRGLSFIGSHGIVHRDIKPANLLVDPATYRLKVCDFGTSRLPEAQEAGLFYVCSRYYRAPELVLSSPSYSSEVDIWASGCVIAEMLLGQPLFAGRDGVDQLQKIAEVLGTPTPGELYAMNPHYDAAVGFGPPIASQPWSRVIARPGVAPEAVELLSQVLQYDPASRPQALEAVTAPLFDELRRDPRQDPSLFVFTPEELAMASPEVQERLRGAALARWPPPRKPMLALRY